jgi:hypothetical protein
MSFFQKKIRNIAFTAVLFALIAGIFGCESTKYITVTIPPKVDLQKYETIGVITFDSTDQLGLAKKCTQRFIESLQSAQPGVLIVELGNKADLLKSVNKTALTSDAIKAIGLSNSVDAIIFAELDVAEPKSSMSVKDLSLSGVSAKSSVKASLGAKLWVAKNGAQAWSDSASGEWTLNKASLSKIDLSNDQSAKYNDLVDDLVYATTEDFYSTTEEREVEE